MSKYWKTLWNLLGMLLYAAFAGFAAAGMFYENGICEVGSVILRGLTTHELSLTDNSRLLGYFCASFGVYSGLLWWESWIIEKVRAYVRWSMTPDSDLAKRIISEIPTLEGRTTTGHEESPYNGLRSDRIWILCSISEDDIRRKTFTLTQLMITNPYEGLHHVLNILSEKDKQLILTHVMQRFAVLEAARAAEKEKRSEATKAQSRDFAEKWLKS